MKEDKDIFSTSIGVPLHYQVKHLSDLTSGAPLPNGLIYYESILENAKYK